MDLAAPVKGWCPVHDRVFRAKDGLCPECGTALVTDDAPERRAVVIHTDTEDDAPPNVVEQEPPRGNRSVLLGVAVAVLVAFIAGLAFPEGEKPTTKVIAPRDVNADLNIGQTRDRARIPLRLESFSQHGRNVVARFTVREGSEIELGKLAGVHVAFALGSGGEISDNVAPRTTVSGFVLSGTFLQRGDIAVTGIRIDSLEFDSGLMKEVPLDISGAWPATTANQPRAAKANRTIRPGDGRTIDIYGLVGWADRLEAGLSVRGGKPEFFYATRYELVSSSTHEGLVTSGSDPGYGSGDETGTVRFEGLPSMKRNWVLRVTVDGILANGVWEWSFV